MGSLRRANRPIVDLPYTGKVNYRMRHDMKPVPNVSKLAWVRLDNPHEVIEESFEGTVEQATAYLTEKAKKEPLFGQVLRNDGFILENVVSC
ncbi:hypothetical protein [Burkholderia cenocepacia]|uniref:hypothetical protein n=1 Tax=Burkholderia cenocepacia TaxID=95486 RepID=UPI00076C5EBA|nr:hypothetical protein [Burkholderia cenocepacia]KWU19174.1 hypothetical protein AS149_13075 [Burkholderia cenocepacia]